MCKFEDVKKDYVDIISNYGMPEDMTGGFVAEEHMEKVILNPTKSMAKKYMIEVIQYGFQWGRFWRSETNGDCNIHDNELLSNLYNKYIYL